MTKTFEDLFNLDRNNYRIAIKVSENYIELDRFDEAYDWGSKALKISKRNAESLSHMGNLYYKAMNICRGDNFSRSDKAPVKSIPSVSNWKPPILKLELYKTSAD